MNQNADEFRNYQGGMGIVDLNRDMIRQSVKIMAEIFLFLDDQLCRIGNHEVLLVDSKQLAILVGVIRIQEQGQILINTLLIEADAFTDNGFINSVEIKQVKLCMAFLKTDHIKIIHS